MAGFSSCSTFLLFFTLGGGGRSVVVFDKQVVKMEHGDGVVVWCGVGRVYRSTSFEGGEFIGTDVLEKGIDRSTCFAGGGGGERDLTYNGLIKALEEGSLREYILGVREFTEVHVLEGGNLQEYTFWRRGFYRSI